ncbi:biopolymer transport protein ExbD [Paenibacillus sp. DS2015]|uniref:hypothetical protein n=1 Tax=Paenibacillus sp. DS2015 TaxID=3373917 RepID=UPI003D24E476
MKKIRMLSWLVVLLLVVPFSNEALAYNQPSASSSVSIPWGGILLKEGHIGKVTILKNTTTYIISGSNMKKTSSALKKGKEVGVFQMKKEKGVVFYKISDNLFVRGDASVKYETLPVSKRQELAKMKAVQLAKQEFAKRLIWVNTLSSRPDRDYILIDLNFDGVPELLGGINEISYSMVDSDLALILYKDGLVNMKFNGDQALNGDMLGNMGLNAFSEIKRYKDTRTDKYIYIAKEQNSWDGQEEEAEYEVLLNSSVIEVKEIFHSRADHEGDQGKTYFSHLKKEVEESDYVAARERYYKDLKPVSFKMYQSKGTHFDDLNLERSVGAFFDEAFVVYLES